jgi:acetyl esterase/lipase
MSLEKIAAALPKSPSTSYGASATDETNLGWLRPGDPRSELLLTIFHSDIGLSLMLNGLPQSCSISTLPKPPKEVVASISPLAHVRKGTYAIPTFVIHGTKDFIAPYAAAERFASELQGRGVHTGFLGLSGVPHVFDVKMKPGMKGWDECVKPGLDFLIKHVRIA